VKRVTCAVVSIVLLGMSVGCACCNNAKSDRPKSDAQPKAPPRILGLDEGWELGPGGTKYSASQTPGEVILKATGQHLTGGYETKLVMSPLRIYPPQWMLAVKKPTGLVTQALTPFEVTASFKANEPVKALHVSDAAGKHEVAVDRARD
jgi:hypothetical protein